jgi:hypothetical protein
MPRGPKGKKRAADRIGSAIKVAKIATGEIEEDAKTDDGRDTASAVCLGRRERKGAPPLQERCQGLKGSASASTRPITASVVRPV